MSNTEVLPAELTCPGGEPGTHAVEVLSAREVPLGGPRAMTVRRTLPQRKRSLIGAWCFADHYGPDDVAGAGMDVPPRHDPARRAAVGRPARRAPPRRTRLPPPHPVSDRPRRCDRTRVPRHPRR